MNIEFIETSIFTKCITELLTDEEYRKLQEELLENPEKGDTISGGGGIKKIRCSAGGQGKSGSIRIIYYYLDKNNQIYMLIAYKKSEKENLTDKETKILKNLVKELKNG